MSAEVITFEGVHLLYGRTLALDLEELRFGAGERVFVLGHSGSGKTTLSRLVKGRLRASTGQVRVLGLDPWAADRKERRRVQRGRKVSTRSIARALTWSLGRLRRRETDLRAP